MFKNITKFSDKSNSKTIWRRSQIITHKMVGLLVKIHKGNSFINLEVKEPMVGHRFGEFAPTRPKYIFKKKKK
jgi:ribosomal protein S19